MEVVKLMEVERYSHVMHISSTVEGKLLPELDAWDALRAALPAGTISGAPKVCPFYCICIVQPCPICHIHFFWQLLKSADPRCLWEMPA